MSKRVSIMLDDDIDAKLRKIQAKKINETSTSYAFSNVINDILREYLK